MGLLTALPIARNIYYHSLIIYDYLTYYNSDTLRVILRRRTEAQTIALIIYDIPCIHGGFCYYVYIEILPLTQDQTDKGAPEKLNKQIRDRSKGEKGNLKIAQIIRNNESK